MTKIKKVIVILIVITIIVNTFNYYPSLGFVINDEEKGNAELNDCSETEEEKSLVKEEIPAVISHNDAKRLKHVKRLKSEEKSEYTLVFKNDDGTKTEYLFAYPIKYKDYNGNWKDISMKLEYDNYNEQFTTVESNIISGFPKKSSDGISLTCEDVNVKMIPITETYLTAVLSKDCEKVKYSLDKDTSYEYSLTYTGIKENIVVNKYTGQTEFDFKLYTNGLELTQIENEYFLKDSKGNIRVNIGDVIIFTKDNKNNALGSMTYETVIDGEEYILNLHVDDDYLKDPRTAYPIKIDPSIEINYTANSSVAIEDVTINSLAGSNGSSGSLFVAKREQFGISRILMKFPGLNLSGLSGPEILSAEVELRDIVCQADPMTVYCYQFAGNEWHDNNATWNNVSPDSITSFLSSNIISYANGLNQTEHHRYKFNILSAVRSWTLSSDLQDRGIQFKTSSAIENGANYITKVFASYNRESNKPSLTVTYADRNTDSWGTISARGKIVTGNNRHFTFVATSSEDYIIKTQQYPGAPLKDTKLYLFNDVTNELVRRNDNASNSNNYSYIKCGLTPGVTYRVFVAEAPNTINGMNCYLKVFKEGSLIWEKDEYYNRDYVNFTKNFNKLGDHTSDYNCFAYAIYGSNIPPNLNQNDIWPWYNNYGVYDPDISQVTSKMIEKNYTKVSQPTDNCVVAYGPPPNNAPPQSGIITHFSRIDNGITRAKLGSLELVKHEHYAAYITSSSYGIPKAYYVYNN